MEPIKVRVPSERHPQPVGRTVLAKCGPAGSLVELYFDGQKFPWGVYEQNDHAGSAVVLLETPNGTYVALTSQWRPTDDLSPELPAGGIGLAQSEWFEGMWREIREEVGEIELVSITAADGFSHDTARKTVKGGGPMAFFPFIVRAKANQPLPEHVESEYGGRLRCHFYPIEDVREMVRNGEIADMVSCFFLLLAGVVEREDFPFSVQR